MAEISAFLTACAGGPSAVVVAGAVGIGKTVVWQHVIRTSCPGARVLSCRPDSAESPLAFAALDDLFGGVIEEVLPKLPEARRRALDAVLLRGLPEPPDAAGDAGGREPERRVLARGILDALRILSTDRPLVLAVDNAQLLDRPSADVLEFCIRRLQREAVSIVATAPAPGRRSPLGLDQALPPPRLVRVRLGPLSRGAIGEILQSRLGTTFAKYTLARLYAACGGNPFYALESARAVLECGRTCPASEPLPVPDAMRDHARHRLRGLTGDSLGVGRLVAASTDPREHVILAAHGHGSWAALDRAIDGGLIERDGDALRFTDPLVRPVMYAEMTRGERRGVHRQLAAHAGEAAERAWHLALSAEGPSNETAAALDAAAGRAASSGEPGTAALLGEQAVRLTPPAQTSQRRERTLRAIDHHFRAGDLIGSRELIESALISCPAGAGRAPLLVRLATIHYHHTGWTLAEQTLRQALAEAPDDPALRAHAEQELALTHLMTGDLATAAHQAEVSLRSAELAARPTLVAGSLTLLAVTGFLRGDGAPADLLDQAEAGLAEEPAGWPSLFSPPLAKAVVLKWCDRLDEARQKFGDCYRQALDRGDEASLPFLLCHLSELECWAGNWSAAEEYARKAFQVASENQQQAMKPAARCGLALVQALRGNAGQARELATEALIGCDRSGNVLLRSSPLSVLGFTALSLGDYQAAHAHLGPLAKAAVGVGLGEPGLVRFLPDEIEALAALGEVSLAESYAQALQAQGRSRHRTWALAAAARCRAHLASVMGDHEAAQAACAEALSAHERLPMPFELARSLLVKGMTERRANRRTEAAASFGTALSIFEQLGAALWAGNARRELTTITTRPAVGELTQTQHRVAALITQGRTNREIASAMFVTENTVQTHVRHIFQKLGVRSRTELTARLLAGTRVAVTPGEHAAAQEVMAAGSLH